ncbi:MAG: hypothetical protein ACPG1A_17310, partial [Halioglobus sp.]
MSDTLYLGVDPGNSGAIAIVTQAGNPYTHIKNDVTDADVKEFLEAFNGGPLFAFVEKVHSMPGNSAKSMFTFGGSFRSLKVHLQWAGIPFDEVTPRKWQKALGCASGGDKKVTKARAQELFPTVR